MGKSTFIKDLTEAAKKAGIVVLHLDKESDNGLRSTFISRDEFERIFPTQDEAQAYRDWLHRQTLRQHRPAGAYVHHIDGDPYNNDPSNLTLVTKEGKPWAN